MSCAIAATEGSRDHCAAWLSGGKQQRVALAWGRSRHITRVFQGFTKFQCEWRNNLRRSTRPRPGPWASSTRLRELHHFRDLVLAARALVSAWVITCAVGEYAPRASCGFLRMRSRQFSRPATLPKPKRCNAAGKRSDIVFRVLGWVSRNVGLDPRCAISDRPPNGWGKRVSS
jgi:hypothetical protein